MTTARIRTFWTLVCVWTAIVQPPRPVLSLPNPRSSSITGRGQQLTGVCPDRCKCKPRAVYCDGIKIEAVPRRLPRNLATLRLKDNRILGLHYDSFRRMFDLRHLIVTGNKVSYVEPTAFKDLYSLISLSLSQNELEWLGEDTFKHQMLLKELSLSRNRLKDVDLILSFLENVQLLNLAENRLEEITERTFQGNVAVRILDLHGNRLRHIHRRAFRRLAALTFLILRDNPLTEVYVQFRVNRQLEQLDITRCRLTAVMKDTPPGLRDLRLSENNIEQVDSADFQSPSSIQLLVLSHNAIGVLTDSAFVEMVALYDLHLTQNRLSQLPVSLPGSLHGLYASFNRITRIGEKCFSAQQHLNSLILSHNRISDIDPRAMRNLKRLVSLDLSHNNIRVLRTGVFKFLYSLQRLDLSNNPLFQLEPKSFVGLENLHILKMSSVEGSVRMKTSTFADLPTLLFLDLSNSSRIVRSLLGGDEYSMQAIDTVEDLNVMNAGLSALPANLRVTLPHLRMVKLTGNPWHCDTNAGWMSQWMRSGDIEVHEPEKMTCSSPPRLKGRRLAELTWNDFAKATVPPRPTPRRPPTTPRRIPTTNATTRPTVPPTPVVIKATVEIITRAIRTTKARAKPTTKATTVTKSTTPTTTTPTTTTVATTTQQPSTTGASPQRSTRQSGVKLQVKRVKAGTNTSQVRVYTQPTTPLAPPTPPTPPTPPSSPSALAGSRSLPAERSSFDYLNFRYPRYSLFSRQDGDYSNGEESSTPDDFEYSILPVFRRHDDDDDDKKNKADGKDDNDDDDELGNDDMQHDELIRITRHKNADVSSKLDKGTT